MSKFRFEWKRNCEENGIWNLEKSAGDTKRDKLSIWKIELATKLWLFQTTEQFVIHIKMSTVDFSLGDTLVTISVDNNTLLSSIIETLRVRLSCSLLLLDKM